MNPEIKKQWVDALRGGSYKQGRSVLRSGDTYCCLGVLCDLHAKSTGYKWTIKDGAPALAKYTYSGASSLLPMYVAQWAEFTPREVSADGSLDLYSGDIYLAVEPRQNLIALNDTGVPFSKIADLIDEYL